MRAMRRDALAAWGVALLVATNAVVLGGAAYNRGGEPDATLALTERETQLPYPWGFESENSGLSLRLHVRTLEALPTHGAIRIYDLGGYAYGNPQWLDRKKLTELGFDLSTPANDPSGMRRYQKQLPKPAFLVLEMEGEAYRASLKRVEDYAAREKTTQAARALEDERSKNGRLFAVDAGLDAEALRAKYADRKRFAIVHGKVWLRDWSDGIGGYVEAVGTTLNVPLRFHGTIGKPQRYDADKPRKYEVSIAFGRRLEPWMAAAAAR